jgi:hypothetical protein
MKNAVKESVLQFTVTLSGNQAMTGHIAVKSEAIRAYRELMKINSKII